MSRIQRLFLVFTALVVFALSAPAAKADICGVVPGNLVTNCGFELGDFTGWTRSSLVNNGIANFAPNSGSFDAFFSTSGSVVSLSQDIATVAGTPYTVSFYLRNHNSVTPNSFAAFFDGVQLTSLTDSATFGYTLFTFSVVATGPVSTLRFDFRHDNSEWFIDDISVTAVPEPATMLLLGTGLLGVTAGIRRRRRMRQ